MPHFLEYPEGMAGEWASFFGRNAPIHLELGCGKGEYTIAMARQYPDANFIGVDLKGDRMWVGAKQAEGYGLHNVAFLRIAIEGLDRYFAAQEVSSIWITFPDPFPKPSKAKRRMVSDRFLSLYEQILKPGGLVKLKTDNANYFQFGLETVANRPDWQCEAQTWDLYQSDLQDDLTSLRTHYEAQWLKAGKTIKYATFLWEGTKAKQ